MKGHLKAASFLLIVTSISIVAMDDYDKVYEGKILRQWAQDYRDLEGAGQLPQCLAFLNGIHPRLGAESPIQMIADRAVLEYIGKFVQPTAADFIYLKHATLGNVKVKRENIGSIGDLKAKLRRLLGLGDNARMAIVFGGAHLWNSHPVDPQLWAGLPYSPYELRY